MLHAAAHAQQPLDPDQVAALLLPPRERPRRGRWLLFAIAIHALAVAALVLASAPRDRAPERIVRVELLPALAEVAPGPPAPPAAAPAPAPERRVAPPAPRRSTPAPVAPRPRARVTPAPKPVAPAPAPTPAAESAPPAAGSDAAGEGEAGVDVASAPPASGNGARGTAGGGGDEIAVYLSRIHRMLSRHQRYPVTARRRGIEGSVLLELRIGADGRIERAAVRGGAPRLLAKSALDAVDRAGRLPAPPGGALAIEVPLRFQLDN